MTDPVLPTFLEGTRFSTDLTGRLIDILISQGVNFVDENVTKPVELAFGDAERVVTGPQKLIQQWMIVFLTKRGSVQANPNFGTSFIRNMEQGRIVTDADVRLEFADATALATDTLDEANVNKPEDEQLAVAELVDFTLTPTLLNMKVNLVSVAGEGTTVILPIPLEV